MYLGEHEVFIFVLHFLQTIFIHFLAEIMEYRQFNTHANKLNYCLNTIYRLDEQN